MAAAGGTETEGATGGTPTTTFHTTGAIPPVGGGGGAGGGSSHPLASASDQAFGAPGEPPEAATARHMLLQVDPSYGTGSPDLRQVAPIVKRVLDAARAHENDPAAAFQLLAVVNPYRRIAALEGPIAEVQTAIEHHTRAIQVQTGTTATETGSSGAPAKVEPITGTPIDEPLAPGSFLGLSISAHPVLLARLGKAEASLQAQVGKTGAELRKELGVHGGEGYKIFRKPPGGYHCFGLAIDINYTSNPYIGGQEAGTSAGDKEAMAAIYHACLLTGRGTPVSSGDSWKRHGKESTADLWQHFHDANAALEAYLMAADDAQQVQAWIAAGNLQRALTPPPGVSDDAKLRAADADGWLAQIKLDREHTHGKAATQSDWWMTGAGQRTGLGFMDLDQRLVVALRDVGGLAWGAADFDESHNGDVMHFDCRNDYSMAQLKAALAKLDQGAK